MNLVGIIMLVATALLNIPTAIEYLSAGTMGFSLDIGIDVTGRFFRAFPLRHGMFQWHFSLWQAFSAIICIISLHKKDPRDKIGGRH